ncbi:hypothetical protein HK097_004276, partial [Rhizophlyctis rosea]
MTSLTEFVNIDRVRQLAALREIHDSTHDRKKAKAVEKKAGSRHPVKKQKTDKDIPSIVGVRTYLKKLSTDGSLNVDY